MRRQFSNVTEDYLSWLKSLGCVLYLPLSEDLQDKISGEYIQLTGNGACVWDSTEGMYKFTDPSSTGQHIGLIANDINKGTFPNNQLTVLHGIKRVSTSNYLKTIAPNTTNGNTSLALCACYNASGNLANFPNSYTPVAHMMNGYSNRVYYQEGAVFNSYAYYSSYLPSNWSTSGDGIKIGYVNNSNQRSTSWYMSEVYLFNTVLDLTTIRKIQGYE